jgi:hypothetical protein
VEEGATAGRKRGSIRKQFGHHSKMVNNMIFSILISGCINCIQKIQKW